MSLQGHHCFLRFIISSYLILALFNLIENSIKSLFLDQLLCGRLWPKLCVHCRNELVMAPVLEKAKGRMGEKDMHITYYISCVAEYEKC